MFQRIGDKGLRPWRQQKVKFIFIGNLHGMVKPHNGFHQGGLDKRRWLMSKSRLICGWVLARSAV